MRRSSRLRTTDRGQVEQVLFPLVRWHNDSYQWRGRRDEIDGMMFKPRENKKKVNKKIDLEAVSVVVVSCCIVQGSEIVLHARGDKDGNGAEARCSLIFYALLPTLTYLTLLYLNSYTSLILLGYRFAIHAHCRQPTALQCIYL